MARWFIYQVLKCLLHYVTEWVRRRWVVRLVRSTHILVKDATSGVCWLTIVDIYVWPSKFHAQSYYMSQKNKEQIIDYTKLLNETDGSNVTFHSNVLIHGRWCNYPYCQSLLLSHEALGWHHGTCHTWIAAHITSVLP